MSVIGSVTFHDAPVLASVSPLILRCVVAALLGTVMTGCELRPAGTPSSRPGSSLESAVTPIPVAWTNLAGDPAPGPVVVEAIARQIRTTDQSIVGAVLIPQHPAGNALGIWVFRAEGITAGEGQRRWVLGIDEARCASPGQKLTLAGHVTILLRHRQVDECQPEYVVQLDEITVAVITDDGAYQGSDAGRPTKPYRPLGEIAGVLDWLEDQLETIELQPGGPPLNNG